VTLLRVRDLEVTYRGDTPVYAVDGVSFDVHAGECLSLIGESGSGKSSIARSLIGLAAEADVKGSIRLGDVDLMGLDEAGWRAHRWRDLSLVFQSTSALNPALTVGNQITEPLTVSENMARADARARARARLTMLGLADDVFDRFPSELSGGQRRLALLAIALIRDPELIVLDEPTAGLDPITKGQVIELLDRMRTEEHRAMLLLTHDIDAARRLADRTAVLYRGRLAEIGPGSVLEHPRHPYSWALLNSHPSLGTLKDLRGVRGDPPDPTVRAEGCGFVDRCTQAIVACGESPPDLVASGNGHMVACVRGGLLPVVTATGLRKTYRDRGVLRRSAFVAVDGVDVEVLEGETLGIVGPNGAGKSTLGKLLVRLIESEEGTILFQGEDLGAMDAGALKAARRRLQILLQDPFEALSPRLTVRECVREPLDIQQIGTRAERETIVAETLDEVRLSFPGLLDRRTHELSGGQLARVNLARALVLAPKLLIADEPFEGVDPSEQAKLLQLLKAIQVERGMALVLVSHDVALVLRTCDRVLVMDEGRVVEQASGTRLLLDPAASTTRRLLNAAGAPSMTSTAEGSGEPATEDLRKAATAASRVPKASKERT
jgi:peptide/nickel transport system ATP-binding protein